MNQNFESCTVCLTPKFPVWGQPGLVKAPLAVRNQSIKREVPDNNVTA